MVNTSHPPLASFGAEVVGGREGDGEREREGERGREREREGVVVGGGVREKRRQRVALVDVAWWWVGVDLRREGGAGSRM
jgi:hypothetical protein